MRVLNHPLYPENKVENAFLLTETPSSTLLANRVSPLPDPHAGAPPVLSPCGALMGQSELRGTPAQHDPDQWEAAGATRWAVLPVLTGDYIS